jgi:hypothetical protein
MMAKRVEDRPASAGQLVSDMEHMLRTGRLPGLFESPPPSGGMKIKKDSRQFGPVGRAPNLRGYGMPGQAAPRPPSSPAMPAQPESQPSDESLRLPKKRRKRFEGGW